VSAARRQYVLQRDPLCVLCHAQRSVEVDHIVSASLGGSDEVNQLQGLCSECHKVKSSREASEARKAQLALRKLPKERHPGMKQV
jgi:5-methylcytosine-specific restriction protein A